MRTKSIFVLLFIVLGAYLYGAMETGPGWSYG